MILRRPARQTGRRFFPHLASAGKLRTIPGGQIQHDGVLRPENSRDSPVFLLFSDYVNCSRHRSPGQTFPPEAGFSRVFPRVLCGKAGGKSGKLSVIAVACPALCQLAAQSGFFPIRHFSRNYPGFFNFFRCFPFPRQIAPAFTGERIPLKSCHYTPRIISFLGLTGVAFYGIVYGCWDYTCFCGSMAEHLTRNEKVVSSILTRSSKKLCRFRRISAEFLSFCYAFLDL